MRHPDVRRRTLHPTPPTQEVITFFFPFIVLDVLASLGPLLSPLSVFTILACRNYYCYLTVCVIPHQGVRQRRPDTPRPSLLLPPEQPCQDRPFFTLALCLRCCLLPWPSPSVAADLIGNLSKVWRLFSTPSGRFARQSSQVHLDVCDIA